MRCPNCGGRGTGKIGNQHYYCWDCCVEFMIERDRILIYDVDDQGELIPASLEVEGSFS